MSVESILLKDDGIIKTTGTFWADVPGGCWIKSAELSRRILHGVHPRR
jgi:hypothetical protein